MIYLSRIYFSLFFSICKKRNRNSSNEEIELEDSSKNLNPAADPADIPAADEYANEHANLLQPAGAAGAAVDAQEEVANRLLARLNAFSFDKAHVYTPLDMLSDLRPLFKEDVFYALEGAMKSSTN